MTFNCYIIGATALVIECAKLLHADNIQINGIFTNDLRVSKWATNHRIRVFDHFDDFINLLKINDFDYLFSVVNPIILDEVVLMSPKKLAINYHDSLLPKYAGVNATAWALHFQEKHHGITWHVMTSKVDAGDILEQKEVLIDQDEILLTLNLKCFEAAIQGFRHLVKNIITNNLLRTPQDLTQRSFYSTKDQVPVT